VIRNAVLRRDAVERVTGLPRSTLYELMAKGTFPKPIRIGARSVGWLEDEVSAWVNTRIAQRDARVPASRDKA
jgi:prophage regulatory protein